MTERVSARITSDLTEYSQGLTFVKPCEQIMKRFGEKLRALRKQRGLSQSDLGDMLGVAQSYVARLEKGKKPSVDLILKISHIFNVCTDILMKDERELKD